MGETERLYIMQKKLNLGCGKNIRDPVLWINADLVKMADCVQVMNIDKTWPFPDNSFDEIHATHVLEHGSVKMHLIQELWRVGADSCSIYIVVPHPSGPYFWDNPQHKLCWSVRAFNIFNEPDWNYFSHIRFEIIEALIETSEDNKPKNISYRLKVKK